MRTPTVPEPFSQREVKPGILEAHVSDATPGGNMAFGGVSPKLERAEVGTAEELQKINDQSDMLALNDAKAKILSLGDNFMPGVVTSKGKDSLKFSPTVAGSQFTDLQKQVQQSIDGFDKPPKLKAALQTFSDKLVAGWQKQAQTHVLKEMTAVDLGNITSNIKGLMDNGVAARNDPGTRDYIYDQMMDSVKQLTDRRGRPDELKAQQEGFTDRYYGNILKAYRDNNEVGQGKALLDDLKSKNVITGREITRQEGWFNQKNDELNAQKFYRDRKNVYSDSNGFPDMAKMDNVIQNSDMTPEQKNTFLKQTHLMFSRDKQEITQQHLDYKSKAIDVIDPKDGKPSDPDAVMKVINSAPTASMRLALGKLAQPSHPELTINIGGSKGMTEDQMSAVAPHLYHQLIDGRITEPQWDDIFAKHAVPKNIYMTGVKIIDGVNKGGASSAMSAFYRDAYQQMLDAFGSQDKATKFNNEVFVPKFAHNANAKGDIPKMQEFLDEKLKPALKDPSHFWDQLKQERQTSIDGSGEASQSLYAHLTTPVVDGLLSSLKTADNPNPSLEDLHGFINNELGLSIDQLGRGTKYNNAIQSILEYNKRHPENPYPLNSKFIHGAAERFPNGQFY